MSNIRLFFPESLSINFKSRLDKSQSHYLIKVMRIKTGENFSLFNKNGEWLAKIYQISKGFVEFSVLEQLRQKENPKEIWLAFAPIKSNYFNFMIQKSTELGVTKFIPVITERTVVRKINNERLNKILIESCEQSNRLAVPIFEKTISLNNFLNNNKDLNIIFGDLNSDNKNLDLNKIDINKPICILIGPEGDFSEKEREEIYNLKNIQYLKINQNILRSETAAISALSIINYIISL